MRRAGCGGWREGVGRYVRRVELVGNRGGGCGAAVDEQDRHDVVGVAVEPGLEAAEPGAEAAGVEEGAAGVAEMKAGGGVCGVDLGGEQADAGRELDRAVVELIAGEGIAGRGVTDEGAVVGAEECDL